MKRILQQVVTNIEIIHGWLSYYSSRGTRDECPPFFLSLKIYLWQRQVIIHRSFIVLPLLLLLFNPTKAGELTRKEAGYVAEILTLAALQAGKNVLVDGSLRDHEWYTGYFLRLREEYITLKLAILHIVAPRDAVFKRAAVRISF